MRALTELRHFLRVQRAIAVDVSLLKLCVHESIHFFSEKTVPSWSESIAATQAWPRPFPAFFCAAEIEIPAPSNIANIIVQTAGLFNFISAS